MRTDSTNLSQLAIGTAKSYITENFGAEYAHPRQFRIHSKGAQEAHEAIRPTFIANTEIEGTAQEQKLYALIWKRTVASQMAEAKVMNTSVRIASDRRSERYGIQASEVLFDGFLRLYSEGTDDADAEEGSVILPGLNIGDALTCKGVNAECKYTQPPFRYSEATLVRKLEELGIGRPSTYAPTISTLTTGRGYLIKGDREGRKVPVTNLALRGSTVSETEKTELIGAEKGKLLPQDIGLIVTDYLVANFNDIMDYDFTAHVEKEFDQVAEGERVWNEVISRFYEPFHHKVDETIHDGQFSHVSRELGVDPADGQVVVARFGQYGPYVQKGEGETRQFASLGRGQLIETLTLEDALKLFELPRTVGQIDGEDVVAMKGKFGPYLRHAGKNYSLPRSTDPLKVSLEECARIIAQEAAGPQAPATPLLSFADGEITVLQGRYGPYIKAGGSNYRIPKGTDPAKLTEQACRDIIAGTQPTASRFKRFRKKTK